MAWVKERNAESTGELTQSDRFRALEQRLLEILDSDARIPAIQKEGRYYYNFWRDAKNPRGPLAAHHAGGISQGQARLGSRARPRRPGQAGSERTGSGTEPRRCGPSTSWPWSRCRAAGPTRPSSASSTLRPRRSSRTATRCPRPRARSAWRGRRQRLRRHRLRPGLVDGVGLSANRQGVEARHAAGRGRGRLRGPDRRTWASSAHRDLTPGFERDIVIRTPTFWTSEMLPPPRRQARQDRQARRRPGLASTANGCCSSCDPTGPSAARRTPPVALIAIDLEAFLKGDRAFDVLFEPTERKSLGRLQPDAPSYPAQRAGQRAEPHRGLDASRRPMAPRAAAGPARVRRGERPRGRRRRLRRLFPEHHRLPDADDAGDGHRRRRTGRDAQAAPRVLRRRGPGRLAARGRLEGRHPHPLFPGRPQATSSSTARTRRCSTATADSRSRCVPLTDRPSARPGSRRGASTSSPTSAAAASSARSGTTRRSRPTGTRPTRTSSPSPRT